MTASNSLRGMGFILTIRRRISWLFIGISGLALLACTAVAETWQDLKPDQFIHLKDNALFLQASPAPESLQTVIDEYLPQQQLWQPFTISSVSDVIKYYTSWQKITIRNPGDRSQRLFIICTEPSTDKFQAAVIRNGRITERWETGSEYPFSERPFKHRLFLLPFELDAGESVTVLAGITSAGNGDFIKIGEQKVFWSWDNETLITGSMQLGGTGILSLLVLFLYLVNRDPTTLFFYIYILNSSIHNLARDGLLDQYLYPTIGGITQPVTEATAYLTAIMGVLFLCRFLEFKQRGCRFMYRFSLALAALNTVMLVSMLVLEKAQHTPMVLITVIFTLIYFFSCWVHSAFSALSRHHHAIVFAMIGLFIVIPLFLNILYFFFLPDAEPVFWLQLRSGDVMFTVALYVALLYDLRRDQLKKQAELVKAEARTQFFATMNHELRTPLNGVIGMAELLNQTDQTPIQKQYSETIINSGNHLLTLINDILDLTRISEGRLEFEQKPYDIDQTLSECLASFLSIIFAKRVPIYLNIQPSMPINLIGDQFRIRQVIYNLLSNAMKFTDKGHILITADADPTHLEHIYQINIRVSDTGIGIATDAMERIFNQFTQADVSTTRRFGGSGLGLAICKAIVEKMNGTIQVESLPDNGSVFTVSYPAEVDLQAELDRKRNLKPLQGKHVLLVSDRPNLYRYFVEHLYHWGVTYTVADSASKALDLIEQEHFDACIFYFLKNEFDQLKPFAANNIDSVVWHHRILKLEELNWKGKLISLPVPTSYFRMESALVALIENRELSATPKTEKNALSNLHAMKILVVEDNPTNQMVTMGMLRHLGLEADFAEHGKQAVEMCEQCYYSLILMDCEMPILDGYEASRQILAMFPDNPPVILALTAQSSATAEERCYKAGMRAIIHKPVTLENLEGQIKSARRLMNIDFFDNI